MRPRLVPELQAAWLATTASPSGPAPATASPGEDDLAESLASLPTRGARPAHPIYIHVGRGGVIEDAKSG
jgi:hypothetical protein